MDKDLPFVEEFFLPSNSRKLFRSTVQRPVSIQAATAVISNVDTRESLAVDVVGVYAPVDGKRRLLGSGALRKNTLGSDPRDGFGRTCPKQLQALVAGALPLVTSKLQFVLPFLNPQIADEMANDECFGRHSSWLHIILRNAFQKPTIARTLCLWGLGVAAVSFVTLIALVGNLFLSESPEWQDFFVRALFVILFLCVGLVIGWCSARIL